MPAAKKLDLELVERLAQIGCTVREIAYVLGVSEGLLRTKGMAALDRGRARLQVELRQEQLRAAKRGNVTMLIWLGKQYLGQSEPGTAEQRKVQVTEELVFKTQPHVTPGDSNGQAYGTADAFRSSVDAPSRICGGAG